MNNEELFCKLFPEYTVNGKPLSPYFDLFESGYEQAENHTEELEKENAELKARLNAINLLTPELEKRSKLKTQQLTKAKEIIREVMNWYWETDICSDSMPPELRQKAEQFLNSEVEK